MQKCTVHKVPTIDETDELVVFKMFLKCFPTFYQQILLKICYRREINNMKTVMNKPHNQKQKSEKQPYYSKTKKENCYPSSNAVEI